MKLLTDISDNYKQSFQLTAENGKTIFFYLEFIVNQNGWFYSWTYDNLTVNGSRLVIDFNILRKYKNRIPFGITVVSSDGVDPFQLDDFVSNGGKEPRVKIYQLDSAEVKTFEQDGYGQI